MSKRNKKPNLDSEYEDRILDEYLAAKDALDAVREDEYGAGLSGVSEHGGAYDEDSYNSATGAAAATAAAAAEAGLDMSSYLRGDSESSASRDAQNGQDDSRGFMKNLGKKKHGKDRNTYSESSYFDDDEISMAASDEGLERFMRSIGFVDTEDDQANAEHNEVMSTSEVVEGVDADGAKHAVGDSFGPAIGVKSPLDGKFDLRKGRVGNALGEGTPYPLLDLDGDYSALPSPEVLAAYPAEVQRKIIEWTDRDVRARRDNESLRQDILLREKISQRKIILFFAVLIVVVCIVCAVATSVLLRDAIYAVVFLLIPMIVVVAALVWLLGFGVTKR